MHSPTIGRARLALTALITGLIAVASVLIGAAPASAASHHITISTYAYHPSALTIAAGDTVTWTNLDSVAHDVTVTRGPALFHSPMLSQGQSWSYTFTVAGPYDYICSVHPDMTATLTVTPATTPSVAAAPAATTAGKSSRIHRNAPTVAPTSVATSSATETQTVPLDTTASHSAINPLLLVGGALCAVMIFCLLVMASRPVAQPAVANANVPTEDAPTRVLPPPPPLDTAATGRPEPIGADQ